MKRILAVLAMLLCCASAHAQDVFPWEYVIKSASESGAASFTTPVYASGSMKVDSYTVYHTGNLAPALSGLTASDSDLLDGYHASTTAAVNTVVVRDASGNISATTASTTGNATVGGTLGVTGKTTTGTLESGAATFTGDINLSGATSRIIANVGLISNASTIVSAYRYGILASNMLNSTTKMVTASPSCALYVNNTTAPQMQFYTSDGGSADPYQYGPYAVWHGGMTSFVAPSGSISYTVNTADGADTGAISFSSASAFGSTRGAYISCIGNEYSAANAGSIIAQCGNVASGSFKILVNTGVTRFEVTNSSKVLFPFYAAGGTSGASLDNEGQIIRTPSDLRLKEDITDITAGLDKVRAMRGVTFNWKDKASFGSRRDYGMIAQEVETVIPEVVSQNPDGMKSLDYQKIVPVLIEAIKDQQRIIESLESRINALEGK